MAGISPAALLATDLDGTLAVDGRIGEADRQAALRLRSAGIPILVVTGRNLLSLGRVEGFWDVADEVLFSSGAGHRSSPQGEVSERARLEVRDVERIVGILGTAGEDFCVLDPVPENHRFAWRRYRVPVDNPDFDRRMKIYKGWDRPLSAAIGPASQILVIRPPGQRPGLEFLNLFSDWSVFQGASPIDHRSVWVEIFPAGLDKGTALAAWCRERGIPRQRVLAVGNDLNDEPMLAWAGHSRVVEGAAAELRTRYPVLPPAGRGGFEAAVELALRLFGDYRSGVVT